MCLCVWACTHTPVEARRRQWISWTGVTGRGELPKVSDRNWTKSFARVAGAVTCGDISSVSHCPFLSLSLEFLTWKAIPLTIMRVYYCGISNFWRSYFAVSFWMSYAPSLSLVYLWPTPWQQVLSPVPFQLRHWQCAGVTRLRLGWCEVSHLCYEYGSVAKHWPVYLRHRAPNHQGRQRLIDEATVLIKFTMKTVI